MSGLNLPPMTGFIPQGPLRGPQEPWRMQPELGRPIGDAQPLTAPSKSEPGGFESLLVDSLGAVSDLQNDASNKTRAMALGEDVELHDVMLAASKSETAFNLMLEIRNKLVDAWEKLSRSAV